MKNKFICCDMPTCKYFKGHYKNCTEPDAKGKCSDIDWCYYKALAHYKSLYEESLGVNTFKMGNIKVKEYKNENNTLE